MKMFTDDDDRQTLDSLFSIAGLGIKLCYYECGRSSNCRPFLYDKIRLGCRLTNSSLDILEKNVLRYAESSKDITFLKGPPGCSSSHQLLRVFVCINTRKGNMLEVEEKHALTSQQRLKDRMKLIALQDRPECLPILRQDNVKEYLFARQSSHLVVYRSSQKSWIPILKLPKRSPDDVIKVDSANCKAYIIHHRRISSWYIYNSNVKTLVTFTMDINVQLFLDKQSQELFYLYRWKTFAVLKKLSVGDKTSREKTVLKKKMYKGEMNYMYIFDGDMLLKTMYLLLNTADSCRVYSIPYSETHVVFHQHKPIPVVFYLSAALPDYRLAITSNEKVIVYNIKTQKKLVLRNNKQNGVAALVYFQNNLLICSTLREFLHCRFFTLDNKKNRRLPNIKGIKNCDFIISG